MGKVWPAMLGAVLLCCATAQAATAQKSTLRRLTAEAAQWRGLYGAVLAEGLQADAQAITPPELELMARLARSPGVASVVYLDRSGRVRWTEDPELLGLPLPEYQLQAGVACLAAEVMTSTAPRVRQVPDSPVYEAAIPILAAGQIQGLLDLWVRRDGLFGLVNAQAAAPRTQKPAPPSRGGPSQAQQYYVSGMVYFEKGDYEKALREWETAHRLDPEDRDVSAGLNRVRQLLGQAASPSGGETRTEDQHRAQQHYLSGVVYYDKGDYARAREEWSQSLRLDPDNADAAAGLARVDRLVTPDASKSCVSLYQAGRYDDAATACAACLEADPNSAACAATQRLLEGRVP